MDPPKRCFQTATVRTASQLQLGVHQHSAQNDRLIFRKNTENGFFEWYTVDSFSKIMYHFNIL